MSYTLKVNHLKFNTKSQGKGDTFIWAHGLLSNMAVEDLSDFYHWQNFPHDINLLRYDARGHGKTESSFVPSKYHWQNLANDMIAIGNEHKVEKFIAGGQSMGCATTLYTALLAPTRVKGIILMNPPVAWQARAEQATFYNKLAKIGGLMGGNILSKIMAAKVDRILPNWLTKAKPCFSKVILAGIKPMKRRTLFNLFKGAALTDLPSKDALKKLKVPTLILAWEGDPSHPVATATVLGELMPHAKVHIADSYEDIKCWPLLICDFVKKFS
mgnify:CR=1 FL=1